MENSFSIEFSFTQEDVTKFAEVTGDNNPIHLDNDYASKTIFKKRIIHGFLGSSIFSKIFGTLYPGEGTIYLKQDLKFLAPMYTNEKYKSVVQIVEVMKEKKRARVKTQILDSAGNSVVEGEALIQNQVFGV